MYTVAESPFRLDIPLDSKRQRWGWAVLDAQGNVAVLYVYDRFLVACRLCANLNAAASKSK